MYPVPSFGFLPNDGVKRDHQQEEPPVHLVASSHDKPVKDGINREKGNREISVPDKGESIFMVNHQIAR